MSDLWMDQTALLLYGSPRTPGHRVRWYAVDPSVPYDHPEHLIPRNRYMRDGDWGWDAKCECGWHTRMGGGLAVRIREMIAGHKAEVSDR